MDISSYLQQLTEMVIEYAPRLFLAALVLFIGMRIINRLVDFVTTMMDKNGLSEDIRPFLSSVMSVGLKLLLIFSVAGIIGIETTSFVAVLAAAGFAVGMALQGSLSNFASGVMILTFRPYRVGDLIQIDGTEGHVREIQIFNTVMITLDNRTIIVPNSMAISGIIINLSARKHLRVDLNVTMPYAEDFPKVEAIMLEALKATPKVLEEPAPFVGIETFDSHSIVLAVRPYCNTEDYWDVYFEANRNIKKALGENNIKVAYSEGVELGKIGQ